MEVSFYLAETESRGLNDEIVVTKGVLFFKLKRMMPYQPDIPGAAFDNKATRDHVKEYGDAYKDFKQANPDYKLAWPELDVEATAPAAPEPVVELVESIIEKVKKAVKKKDKAE